MINLVYDDTELAECTRLFHELAKRNAIECRDSLKGIITDIEKVKLIKPHQVFSLRINYFLAGQGIHALQLKGLRLLISENENIVAAIVIPGKSCTDIDAENPVYKIETGPDVASTIRVLRKFEFMSISNDFPYHFNFVAIPGLEMCAVWLKSSVDNWFMPIGDVPTSVSPYRLHSEREFFEMIRRLINERR